MNDPDHDCVAIDFAISFTELNHEEAYRRFVATADPGLVRWLTFDALRKCLTIEERFAKVFNGARERKESKRFYEILDHECAGHEHEPRGDWYRRLLGSKCTVKQVQLLERLGLSLNFFGAVEDAALYAKRLGGIVYGNVALRFNRQPTFRCDLEKRLRRKGRRLDELIDKTNELFLDKPIQIPLQIVEVPCCPHDDRRSLVIQPVKLAEAGPRAMAVDEAVDWLCELIAKRHRIPAQELKSLASAKGCGASTLRTALKKVGAEHGRKGSGPGSQVYWHLRGKGESAAEAQV
jgi:hypothetical protein